MGKRVFSPMPQTTREKPGEKFKIMRRVTSIICHPKRDQLQPNKGWMPVSGTFNLKRLYAESLLENLEASKHGDMFEYAIVPMDQEVPE